MLIQNVTILVLLATLITPGVTTVANEGDIEDTRKKLANPCINTRTQSYFSPMTDKYLFVENGMRKYLLTLQRGCRGARQGYNFTFESDSTRVCSSHRTKIGYTDRQIVMPSCRIESIEEVKSWNEASGLITQREEEKKKEDKKKKDD